MFGSPLGDDKEDGTMMNIFIYIYVLLHRLWDLLSTVDISRCQGTLHEKRENRLHIFSLFNVVHHFLFYYCLDSLHQQSVFTVSIGFFFFWKLFVFRKINKMKPTNPNADTFVEGERQYLSHFLPDIVVGHPDMTHWFGSLVGRTLLLDTVAQHSCETLWFDESLTALKRLRTVDNMKQFLANTASPPDPKSETNALFFVDQVVSLKAQASNDVRETSCPCRRCNV